MLADTDGSSGVARTEVELSTCTAPCTPKCQEEAVANGLCNSHRMRAKRGLPIDQPIRKYKEGGKAKTHAVTIKLSDETQEALERIARKRGLSVYALVLSTVEELAETASHSKT